MHDAILSSGRDTILVAIPLIGILMLGMFRLDEVFFAAPKGTMKRNNRAMCGIDEHGQTILTDPDGRVWSKPQPQK